MKLDFQKDGYLFLTDDTSKLDAQTLFLKTSQNTVYYDSLENKPASISIDTLIAFWGLGTMRVVGVTGTNGKTTVTGAIYSFLLDLGEKPALQGTRGLFAQERRIEEKSMTTPSIFETLHNMKQTLDLGCNYFIMEVSSHAIDQKRIEGLTFALKVHTNVTSDHLDYHGTVEEYRRVKSLFFDDASPKLLNKDDIKHITYNPIGAQSYGVDEPATFKVQAFSLLHGITAGIKHLKEEATFHSPMVGLFNLFNLMAAIGSVQMLTRKSIEEICEVVPYFAGVSGRMEVVSREPLVIVDFAHTDDGMLQVFEAMKDRDISVVFGAGGNRDKSKRPRMGAVAGRYANKIYVTSDNPRDEVPEMILEEILLGLHGKENVTATPDRKLAIKLALEALEKDEVLLILGKGDEDYQEIKGVKHHFDDREVVRELLAMN
ncbi:MAG TPA: UDP-N-acetylmuramoyl-L-alanyl-D-glutamate--2,6-diaminopimelate ligase [Sulfurovum sp.]|nr:MAG: UDP-N-acetylmuramoyl-L-alanyl-D-glutamate--2,6-diaminopimelate ligase [Sulfurovum sp. 16-42-52]OYZ49228.1 MAG: UDP-N-acetylmuramoyl-L-alanyl-D-glutamate--2,6-diaminopimelate ligase [Sulfurovum sp. 24-42-9]HQR72991.1 UDP-N-acetylmuramoyl-L-alanyl-D-glutamate--2,6-diaminopimelate ligase [Sulfurovum sp.]HQS73191.1 UDP-N-acetylmuramoyl-L-alanyl-D-glutamate--2,6-diaminopimelate ligase [Sulfurovum sp.]HQS76823.1 UDP-N-acetylmuramoyl-L-alanyl-D-glutamate--2,6-diaminopimelate ligase [Sulfurovum